MEVRGHLYLLSVALGIEFKSGHMANTSIHLRHFTSCPPKSYAEL